MMKSTINPYVAFKGNCKEAMEFYKSIFGGELELMDFSSAPMDIPEEYKSKIMHAKLQFGNAVIMASDTMPNNPINVGDNVSISLGAESVEVGTKCFNSLSEGGKVLMPFADAFWGSKFGMLEDKFGVRWMIDCSKAEFVSEK